MRKSGILMPISSLPSKYGIGAFSKEAYDFVDLLKETNQSLWQILPLGPTSYGDSPYQSISTFAGNLYFIDLEELIEEGLLTEKECTSCDWGDNEEYIDYGKIYSSRFKILRQAYKRSNLENDTDYIKFCKENEYWLKDYALYIAIKNSNESKSWTNWDEDIRLRKVEAINFYEESLRGQKYVMFNAIKVKEVEDKENNVSYDYKAVVHFVVYDIPAGEKPELKKRVKQEENIVKAVGHVKKAVHTVTYTGTTFINEMADLSDDIGKFGGSLVKATMKIGTNIGHELSTSFMEGLNDSFEGKNISEKDKRRHQAEKARLMNNLGKIKARFSNNDEDDDF
jgi:hypothetical protein